MYTNLYFGVGATLLIISSIILVCIKQLLSQLGFVLNNKRFFCSHLENRRLILDSVLYFSAFAEQRPHLSIIKLSLKPYHKTMQVVSDSFTVSFRIFHITQALIHGRKTKSFAL